MTKALSLFFLIVIGGIQANAKFEAPPIRAHINDNANIIPRKVESALNSILAQVKSESGIEMAVLTLKTLQNVPIEVASIDIVDKWKLGEAQGDKGLLLLVSMKERKLRIEVGQGLEGELTDAESKRIIDQTMVPLLKSGDTGNAIYLGVYQILKTANPTGNYDNLFANAPSHKKRSRKGSFIGNIIWILLFAFFFAGRSGLLPLLFLGSGGFRGRGGFSGGGGFGGGGGSFGGGGGGFSGGGASGGW